MWVWVCVGGGSARAGWVGRGKGGRGVGCVGRWMVRSADEWLVGGWWG